MKSLVLLFLFCFGYLFVTAQYAPQAGLSGSQGIYYSSSQFVGWATGCKVQRGYMNIADTSLGLASSGIDSNGTGIADDNTVSLGDSGIAVLTFSSPVYDSEGPDFAVFENGFIDPANDSAAFLELGFVEVSSDSLHFVRFPASSLTQNKIQLTNDDYMYANLINNLAGNYIAMYGTPFDLHQLADSPNLDISNVRYVRIIDVVGSINGHSTFDASGRIVNDPYPTAFPSCGFDLDAVGTIHQREKTEVLNIGNTFKVSIYPNPVTDHLMILPDNLSANLGARLYSPEGKQLARLPIEPAGSLIDMQTISPGLYYLVIDNINGEKWATTIIKN